MRLARTSTALAGLALAATLGLTACSESEGSDGEGSDVEAPGQVGGEDEEEDD